MLANKVIWKIFIAVVILSMCLAACAPAATPTAAPTTPPTTAPVAGPTTAPAASGAATATLTVLEAAEQAAQLAPLFPPVAPTLPANATGARPVPAGGWKYAFIGAITHPYYNPFPIAFKQAENDLPVGKILWEMPQQFDQNVQNQLIDGAVAQGYNLMGVQDSDPAAGNVEIAKVVAQGIPVVSFAGCANQPSPNMYCLATDVGQSAYYATTQVIKQMGGKGNIVHFSGNNADANTKLRIDGVAKAVAENPGVTLLQTIVDDDSAETAQNAVSSVFASKGSQINGIVATAYNPSVAIANQLTSENRKDIVAVLQDPDPIVTTAIANGFVYGTMSQNPYGQAYIGVYSLYLWTQGYTWKKSAPWYIDSGSFLITKDNLATVTKAMADLTQKMVSTWAATYFDAPAGSAPAATTAPATPAPAAGGTATLTVLEAAEQAAQLAPLFPPVAPTLPANATGARPVPAGGWKYAFIGAITHPYYNPFPIAFKQAENDLPVGKILWEMPQQFDQNVQNQLIDGAVAQGYNLMGVQDSDPAAGNVEIAKVVAQGIPVVSFAGCANQPSPNMYCLATDVGQSAYYATTQVIKQMGGKGNIVHFSGNNADANTKLRIDGVAKAVAENPGVTLLQTIVDDDSAETAQNAVSSVFASKGSQINGIVATAYNPSVAIANELTSENRKDIVAVLQDPDPIVTTAIANGFVYGTMSQNPYGQAYIGVYSLYLWTQGYTWKKSAPWYIDSGSFLITKDNLATVTKAMADLTQKMVSTWAATYFDAPK